jgi:hypothetical protein
MKCNKFVKALLIDFSGGKIINFKEKNMKADYLTVSQKDYKEQNQIFVMRVITIDKIVEIQSATKGYNAFELVGFLENLKQYILKNIDNEK